jgi:hypothetical protein
VIRDVAAALDLDHLDVAGREDMGQRPAGSPERDDVRVLDQQQRIPALAALPLRDQLELANVRLAIPGAPQVDQIRGQLSD